LKLLSIFSVEAREKSPSKNIKRRGVHFTILPLVLVPPIFMKLGIRGQLTDIIMCVKFLVDRFRGYRVLTPQNCHFPLTCCIALTTVYALPYNTVMMSTWMTTITIWSCLLHNLDPHYAWGVHNYETCPSLRIVFLLSFFSSFFCVWIYKHLHQYAYAVCASDSPATYGALQMCFDWFIDSVQL